MLGLEHHCFTVHLDAAITVYVDAAFQNLFLYFMFYSTPDGSDGSV